ncbi:hypothetical protein P9112_012739 [Eukaryota sp. TZLM1-RC]
MSRKAHTLPHPISLHSWNGDFSQIAMVPTGSHDVLIYDVLFTNNTSASFNLVHKLSAHVQTITDIDWCNQADRIVTCSEDCSIRVWNYDETRSKWIEQIVHTQATRAAFSAEWSPCGKYFALGNGMKTVSRCFYDEVNKFWTDAGKENTIKKPHKSAVTNVAWSPDSLRLATACTDCHFRVFDLASRKTLIDIETPSWIDAISFSTNDEVAFSCHNATLHFINVPTQSHETLLLRGLPERCLVFVNPDTLIGGGYDCNPHVYKRVEGKWTFEKALDQPKEKTSSGVGKLAASFQKFQLQASVGSAAKADYALETIHQNTIFAMSLVKGSTLCTTSSDGKLVLWSL